jgi:cellulose synthase/poly-beta-1,6-N-acetylglucosamine synthase-like glycosyltransferase
LLDDLLFVAVWAATAALAIPLTTFWVEVMLGLREGKMLRPNSVNNRTYIIMPAHNEVDVLGETLEQLLPALPEGVCVLVIADNCTDQTADVASSYGATVIKRHDSINRGKGHALAFGRDWLRHSTPDCVVVLDADCQTDRGSLEALIAAAVQSKRPVQASNMFTPDLSAPPKIQISNFAMWIKNVVRQRGTQKLGGAANVTGTGMAFPWSIFETLPLATNSIVEDLELAVELTKSGRAPVFLECARITSLAANEEATLVQRSRWEHGFLTIAKAHSIPTLAHGIKSFNWQLVLLGLHLLVPPLALLLSIAFAVLTALLATAIWTDIILPAVLVACLVAAVFFSLFLAWLSGGYRWLSTRSLLVIPLYVLWKIPVYLRFAVGRRSEWVRTDRTP